MSPRRRSERWGYTLLEVQVAFILLGIGLAGVGPLVVLQVRLSGKMVQQGFNPQTGYFRPGTTYYLVPSSDAWERKLGVAATVQATAPGASGATSPDLPAYVVSVVGPVQKGIGTENVIVVVTVTAASGSSGGASP
jgi:hypothetical protein